MLQILFVPMGSVITVIDMFKSKFEVGQTVQTAFVKPKQLIVIDEVVSDYILSPGENGCFYYSCNYDLNGEKVRGLFRESELEHVCLKRLKNDPNHC